MRFHKTCGSLVEFSNNYCTAERKKADTDFYEGVVFSSGTLKTNTIFQVRVDKKIEFWSGGIQVGVTIIDPNELSPETVPQSATELRYGTWLMTSKTMLKDGEVLMENYGSNLESLEEGDTVGIMRTSQGSLVYFIHGVSQGVAVGFVPEDIYVVVNLYGKCAKVSVVDVQPHELCSNTVEFVVHRELETNTSDLSNYQHMQMLDNNANRDKLKFHTKCGPLVKLSNSRKTAERRRPLEEFNNSVVLTHRPLRENELFQVRIDMLVHKWSGSIEFGLITHNPADFNCGVDFPATLTVLRNGSVIMSGNGILHDGKATNSPYIGLNLDQLQEGDRLGVMKNSNGDVVYFVNGESQGVAATGIFQNVWGAVNLYGMCSRVTIVDRNDHEEYNLRLNLRDPVDSVTSIEEMSELLFHPHCGFHAAVINNGRTCHRPEASQDFNHGVVLTNRTLKPNEMFEVRLDKMVKKWAGSIEIGVTTHRPTSLEYPCTMTNVRSGTWMMTGNGIMHNGQAMIDDYGQSLDRLKVGDRVSVLRKENGDLHFFVNGVDQGVAATGIPEAIYGVIDLYGQAAQATILTNNAFGYDNYCSHDDRGSAICFGGLSTPSGDGATVSGDLKFHSLHAKNARISNNGFTASRPNARGEFNAAIVVSNRPLRDNELFEVIIEKMVDRWSGNIEAGVTTIRPENLLFPNTMTDLDHDTIMLSGSSIMSGGHTLTTRYACNLDCLTVGSRVGMMRKSDDTLHFFINGEDMGVAANDVPQNIYAVVDLYGQCAQVSITRVGDMSMVSSQVVESLISLPIANDTAHRFSLCCGKNIVLKNNNLTACRVRYYNNAVIFSSSQLDTDEMFEVRITEVSAKWAGSFIIGLTSLEVNDELPVNRVPTRVTGLNSDTWHVKGSTVFKNQVVLRQNYCVNLNRLCLGDRVGIRIDQDKCMRICINGEDMGIAAYSLPRKLHVVLELYGSTTAVTITSSVKSIIASPGNSTPATGIAGSDSCHSFIAEELHGASNSAPISKITNSNIAFGKHAGNIELSNGDTVARRISGHQGIVFAAQALEKGRLIQLKIDRLNPKWASSIIVGITETCPDKITSIPSSSLSLKGGTFVVISDCLYENGVLVKKHFCSNIDNIQAGDGVSVFLDLQDNVHLLYNGCTSVLQRNISGKIWLFVDLFGETEQVTIFPCDDCPRTGISNINLLINEYIVTNSSSFSSEKYLPVNSGDPNYCDYFQACQRFKASLCLPEIYFLSTEPATCFCSKCMHFRGEDSLKEQGDPLEKYTVPRNWVRFPVNINIELNNCSCDQNCMNGLMTNSTSSLSNVLTTWHVAFYGIPIYQIRQVMDYGQLRFPDEYNACYEGVSDSDSTKDENNEAAELIFSPMIHYASIDQFATPKKGYLDAKTKQRHAVKAVLELLVQPGSYRTNPGAHPLNPIVSQTSAGTNIADKFDLDKIEWSTKEQGATHVAALLLCIEGFPITTVATAFGRA